MGVKNSPEEMGMATAVIAGERLLIRIVTGSMLQEVVGARTERRSDTLTPTS
jgi:hypothetical protein